MRWLICTIYLLVCAAEDGRRLKISLRASVCAGCAALILDGAAYIIGRSAEVLTMYAGGLVPGAMLLILAFLTGGASGTGDGICYLVLGALLGMRMTWILLMCALLLAAVSGAAMMLLGKAGRKTRMPFLPFTAAAWAGILAVHLSGIKW